MDGINNFGAPNLYESNDFANLPDINKVASLELKKKKNRIKTTKQVKNNKTEQKKPNTPKTTVKKQKTPKAKTKKKEKTYQKSKNSNVYNTSAKKAIKVIRKIKNIFFFLLTISFIKLSRVEDIENAKEIANTRLNFFVIMSILLVGLEIIAIIQSKRTNNKIKNITLFILSFVTLLLTDMCICYTYKYVLWQNDLTLDIMVLTFLGSPLLLIIFGIINLVKEKIN